MAPTSSRDLEDVVPPFIVRLPLLVSSFGSNAWLLNRQEHILFPTKDTSSDYRYYRLYYVLGWDLLIGNMSHMRVVWP